MLDKLALIYLRADSGDTDSMASSAGAGTDPDAEDACGVNPTDRLGLRVGAIFIILVTSMFGATFPVLTKRVGTLRRLVPGIVFEFAKFFGSGVILATSLIHLLEPAADDELGPSNTRSAGGCINDAWGEYPYAFGICLFSLFVTFVIELFAYRLGTQFLAKRGIAMNPAHSHGLSSHAHRDGDVTHGAGSGESPSSPLGGAGVGGPLDPEMQREKATKEVEGEGGYGGSSDSVDRFTDASEASPAGAQILGVAILEFGVIFHSVIIGLTLALASPDEFTVLFIVIIFHQMFEGLGLGTRLAFLRLPPQWNWVPFAAAIAYAFVTPIGMAIGLGTRESTSMTSANASIAAGILDSISAGILLYAATVELIAHEFIFNSYYHTCSNARIIFVIVCFGLGAGIMALLGKWA